MKVLLSWLREFTPLAGDPAELGEVMSDLGMAVESMERRGEGLDGIVVAEVLDLRPHPGADKIQLVDVDLGDGEALQICCGAFNMAVGDKVPLATLGTVMPNGMKIERRKLRGEWSNGMLCSAAELNLGGDHAGIMVLPAGVQPGVPFTEALGIDADVLYDLEINPNRPDAMSIAGVARDVAARLRLPFSLPSPSFPEGGAPGADATTVEIVDTDLCGRFAAKVLRNVAIGPSPTSLASRLTLLGMRPINNVVDVSNYVMLELGQPNHPYDLARLPGRGLRVRRARDGETMVTLDEVERRFTTDDLLICDAEDAPVGIAGIMGGASSEISDATTDVLLEMAWFQPMSIAKTSRRLKLRTEASARFERGCDPEVIDLAMARFCELLLASSPDFEAAPGTVDRRGDLPARPPVRLRTARVNAVLGSAMTREEIKGHLDPIGFTATEVEGDLDVDIPSWRYDSATEIDVIEEVARHHGYARIPKTVPPSVHVGGLSTRQQERRLVRSVLTGLGLNEAMPMPFLGPGDLERCGLPPDGIEIANPLVAEESILRTSLLPGLLKAMAYNASHRNAGVALFEIGHVFRVPAGESDLPDERELVAAAWAGRDARTAVEIWDAVADALGVADPAIENGEVPGLHPTRTARVSASGEVVGAIGEVDPSVLEAHGIPERVAWVELDLGRLLDQPHGGREYRPVSRFPSSDVDLAFEVDDAVPASRVAAVISDAAGDLLADLRLFDVFRGEQVGEGRRSLAFSLRLQAIDRTLTDDELASVRQQVIDAVQSALPATLRG
jgi:phenylalanyl-tRNA synthetase beta chain